MSLDHLLKDAEGKMDKAIQSLDHEMAALRTGRASAHALDGILVKAYGTDTAINQVATINTPDAATITVQPWDTGILASVEKAILGANLGMTPSNDGKIIRLRVPSLTEETRKQMVKKAHEVAEHGRVAVRNVRRHVNDEVKKTEKEHDITEDERKRLLDQIQKRTDQHIKKIDELLTKKEAEIMHV